MDEQGLEGGGVAALAGGHRGTVRYGQMVRRAPGQVWGAGRRGAGRGARPTRPQTTPTRGDSRGLSAMTVRLKMAHAMNVQNVRIMYVYMCYVYACDMCVGGCIQV